MDLRGYQVRTLTQAWEAMQQKLRILITAPCSAGKTILFSKIIQRLLREQPGFRVLILVDREILVSQSRDKLKMVAPELTEHIGIVCASVSSTKTLDAPVTIASKQSLVNNLDKFPPVQLIIIDEVHLVGTPHQDEMVPDQWGKIITRLQEYNPLVRLIGCTASPYRLGSKGGYIYGNRNREDAAPYFDCVDAEITTRELLDGNFITKLTGMASVSDSFQADLTHVGMVAGEFNLGQVSTMMCRPVHVQSCVDAWLKFAAGRKKTLVFCASIEHAEQIAAAFNNHGISSCAIHSKLSQVDDAIRMKALADGTMQVFTSVAKLTTGMDVSDIDTIIMARPTKSTALYQQCIGRGQRLAEGKEECLVIDLTGCTSEFGTDMDHLNVAVPRSAGGGEAPAKICPGTKADGSVCGQSVHASLKFCPTCSYEFPATEEVQAAMGVMKEVVFNEIPEPETIEVTEVGYAVHTSAKSGFNLIKVTYYCGHFTQYNEWVCLPDFYSGFAVDKALAWWEERTAEPFPDTVEEFMFLKDELMTPVRVIVQKKGKYGEVTGCQFVEYGDVSEDEFNAMDSAKTSFSDDVPF